MIEPPMGRCRDGVHIFAARVYYEDTDAGGVVYHTSYLRLAERARTEMMRSMGFSHGLLFDRYNVLFALRRCTADFRLPARLDDALEVQTRVMKVAGPPSRGSRSFCATTCRWFRWRRRWPVSSRTGGRHGCPTRFVVRLRIFA